MIIFIYVLKDPRTNLIRYVGKTRYPELREQQHNENACKPKYEKFHVSRWVRSLHELDLKPVFQIIDQVESNEEANKREKFYITKFKEQGFKLTNQTPGGDGGPIGLGRKYSPEHCKAISKGLKGKLKGRVPWNKGLKTGKPAWNSGKKTGTSKLKGTKRGPNLKLRKEVDVEKIKHLRFVEKLSINRISMIMGIGRNVIQKRLED